MVRCTLVTGAVAGIALTGTATAGFDILVFDDNSVHSFAATAAANIGNATVGDQFTFNGLLAGGTWDLVVMDTPSTIPSGGWGNMISHVNNGGRGIVTFWDWDNGSGFGDPGLAPAFDVATSSKLFLTGQTLNDTGASGIFSGVTMPNNDWHDHWFDDGDFFIPQAGAVGLATMTGNPNPVMVEGNEGRTIASFVLDEAGDTWINDGSAVRLWENMMLHTLPAPGGLALLGLAGFACTGRRRHA
jgi:hypothetical protein